MSIFTLLFILLNHFFSRARFYAAEIASAIGYLHSLQIIYRWGKFFFLHNYLVTSFLFSSLIWNFFFYSSRDLKPENILLDGRVSGVFSFYACNNPQVYLKAMLHETSRNDDFWRNTALQHCFECLQHCLSFATLSCLKNSRCESSRVTSFWSLAYSYFALSIPGFTKV